MAIVIDNPTPGWISCGAMDRRPWRERVQAEEELLEQLQLQISQAAKRRAEALLDGVNELGTVANVARDLGKTWTAVDKAIKKHGPDPGPETTP